MTTAQALHELYQRKAVLEDIAATERKKYAPLLINRTRLADNVARAERIVEYILQDYLAARRARQIFLTLKHRRHYRIALKQLAQARAELETLDRDYPYLHIGLQDKLSAIEASIAALEEKHENSEHEAKDS